MWGVPVQPSQAAGDGGLAGETRDAGWSAYLTETVNLPLLPGNQKADPWNTKLKRALRPPARRWLGSSRGPLTKALPGGGALFLPGLSLCPPPVPLLNRLTHAVLARALGAGRREALIPFCRAH